MSRPSRIVFPGAWYHVFSQGTGNRPVFESRDHGEAFLRILGEATGAAGAEVHAYCLMHDAYHLLLRTPRGNLPQMMRQLNGQYAHWCRRRRGSEGKVFGRRYHAVLLEAEAWLLRVSRHLHRLPVDRGLVEDATMYRWSSLRALCGKSAPPAWLQVNVVQRFAGGPGAYLDYVAYGTDAETEAFYARERLAPVLGNPRIPPVTGDEQELPAASMDAIIRRVAEVFGVDETILRTPRRGRGRQATPRAVTMLLARSPGGHSLEAVARALGVQHVSTVSVTARKCRDRLQHDRSLRERVHALAREISSR